MSARDETHKRQRYRLGELLRDSTEHIRPDDAPVGDWADALREVPRRVADWIEWLQGEGIGRADWCSPASARRS